ncbi:hypothetical protein AL346_19155 [Chelatococcus sp. CO-6]|nr:hypothetical protein AL346_19155 [Chelatococcus sp. CO-6]
MCGGALQHIFVPDRSSGRIREVAPFVPAIAHAVVRAGRDCRVGAGEHGFVSDMTAPTYKTQHSMRWLPQLARG